MSDSAFIKKPADPERALWQEGYNQGRTQGRIDTRKDVLTFLQGKFMNMSLPTDDPVMVATLNVAKELSEYLKIEQNKAQS